jgi:aspartyl-tRNA synthetase
MSHVEALNTYGSDKPDIRFGMTLNDVTSVFENSSFSVFKDVVTS